MAGDYPQGNPESGTCRWCGQSRLVLRGGRVCRSCDGPAFTVSPEPEAKS